MPTITPPLYIPPEYQKMLDAGELWRDGGVLRRTVGATIALILKDGPSQEITEEVVSDAVVETSQKIDIGTFIKNHKISTIGVGAVLLVTFGTGIYLYIQKKQAQKAVQAREQQSIKNFQMALTCYLKAVIDGKLTPEIIDNLSLSLDNFANGDSQDYIRIEFASEDIRTWIKYILGYTVTLADANNYKLNSSYSDSQCNIINLQNHLKAQKEIIEFAS